MVLVEEKPIQKLCERYYFYLVYLKEERCLILGGLPEVYVLLRDVSRIRREIGDVLLTIINRKGIFRGRNILSVNVRVSIENCT